MIPVQTINPFIADPPENEGPAINTIIEDERAVLSNISDQFGWNAVDGYTLEDTEPNNTVRSAVSTIRPTENKLITLASLSAGYSQQEVRISKLEEEAANEQLTGREREFAVEQARANAGGWSLVNTFSAGFRIFEPRVFEGNFRRSGQQGIIVYHPEGISLTEDDSNYLFQETAGLRNAANRVGLNTQQVDEFNPFYILLSPGSDPLTGGVNIGNKILLTNIENLSDPEVRKTISHELVHALFGLTPIPEHTEGLAVFLSGLRHPEDVNINELRGSELAPALGERFSSIPLSVQECISAGSEVIRSIKNLNSDDFSYVYGYNFAMSFFEYFEDQGPEYAFEKYMEFYGALKRGVLFSFRRAEPSNQARAAMLIQAGQKLPDVTDSEVTQEALTAIGIDPEKFKKDLGKTMRSLDTMQKQKELSEKLAGYFN